MDHEKSKCFDVAIIGGGIVGCSLFRELSRYRLDVALLEKENDVSLGSSRANSAIVHAGYDPAVGTLMARLNVAGNALYPKLCDELSVPFRKNGSMICALSDGDLEKLTALLERGRQNGVPDLAILSRSEAFALEPNLADDVVGALLAPSGGIVGAYEMTTALAENAVVNGGRLWLDAEVVGIEKAPMELPAGITFPSDESRKREIFRLTLTGGRTIRARFVVNAAGVFADQVNDLIAEPFFKINPRKGEYYVFDKSQGKIATRTLFVCPGKFGKGVLVSPTVHGNLIAGPDAQDGCDPSDTATTAEGLAFVRENARLLTEKINFRETIRNFAGLRAVPDQKDFIIGESPTVKGFFNLAGIKSPGLTSAPAIAEMARDLLADAGLELIEKTDFNPHRHETRFLSLSAEEKAALIRENPAFGRVICRCETITEGEIVEAIQRPVGATTLDGVKRRCRPGCGRCQGGFCAPRVLEILARELGENRRCIEQDRHGSYLLADRTK